MNTRSSGNTFTQTFEPVQRIRTFFTARGWAFFAILSIFMKSIQWFDNMAIRTRFSAVFNLCKMMSIVYRQCHQFQVIYIIVGFVTVFMMHNFVSIQGSTKMLSHNPTVQQVVLPVTIHSDIAIRTDISFSVWPSFNYQGRTVQPLALPVHRTQTISSNFAPLSASFYSTSQHSVYSTLDNILSQGA